MLGNGIGVLVKSVETVRARVMFYKAVLQAVLLYGSDRWVITYSIIKVMERFYHHIYWRITGNMERRVGAEGWELGCIFRRNPGVIPYIPPLSCCTQQNYVFLCRQKTEK